MDLPGYKTQDHLYGLRWSEAPNDWGWASGESKIFTVLWLEVGRTGAWRSLNRGVWISATPSIEGKDMWEK